LGIAGDAEPEFPGQIILSGLGKLQGSFGEPLKGDPPVRSLFEPEDQFGGFLPDIPGIFRFLLIPGFLRICGLFRIPRIAMIIGVPLPRRIPRIARIIGAPLPRRIPGIARIIGAPLPRRIPRIVMIIGALLPWRIPRIAGALGLPGIIRIIRFS
jgi:hypothetical protein